jgi:hypothetical protein
MALKKCKECGKEVSTSAKLCPNCGKNNPTGDTSKAAILFLVFLIVLALAKMIGPSESEKAWNAKAERQRTIWDANPGAEQAMLECVKLADISEKYQTTKLASPGYSRGEVFDTCMRNKGFGHALEMLNRE